LAEDGLASVSASPASSLPDTLQSLQSTLTAHTADLKESEAETERGAAVVVCVCMSVCIRLVHPPTYTLALSLTHTQTDTHPHMHLHVHTHTETDGARGVLQKLQNGEKMPEDVQYGILGTSDDLGIFLSEEEGDCNGFSEDDLNAAIAMLLGESVPADDVGGTDVDSSCASPNALVALLLGESTATVEVDTADVIGDMQMRELMSAAGKLCVQVKPDNAPISTTPYMR